MIVARPELRDRQLWRALAEELGISARQAARYVAHAREELAAGHDLRIAGLRSVLPDLVGDCIARCREARDLRAEVRALELARKIVEPREEGAESGIPDRIIIETMTYEQVKAEQRRLAAEGGGSGAAPAAPMNGF